MENWDRALQEQEGRISHANYWSSMPTFEICGDNHRTEYCQFNYNTGWQNYQNYPQYNNERLYPPEPNYQNFSLYYTEDPTYPPEPTYEDFSWYNNEYPAYPPEPYYPEFSPQDPQPSMEDCWKSELVEMIRQNGELLKNHEEMLDKSAAETEATFQRMQSHLQKLINNQSSPPQETLPDKIEENLWDQEELDELSKEIQMKLFDKVLEQNKAVVEQEAEYAVIQEERHEQIWDHIETVEIPEEIPSEHGIVNLDQTAQKLERTELPFQVKHPTRPPDGLLLHLTSPRKTEVAWSLQSKNFYLPPLLCNWDAVPTRESKATVKPP